MKTILAVFTCFLFFVFVENSYSDWAYDTLHNQNTLNNQRVLKYNPYNNSYHYEQPNTELQYNPYNNQHEYHEPGWHPKYNPYNGSWE